MPNTGEGSLFGEKANRPNEARDRKIGQGALGEMSPAQQAAEDARKFEELRRRLAEKQGLNPTAEAAPQPQPEKPVAPKPQPEKSQPKPESKGEKDKAKVEKAVEKQKNNKPLKYVLTGGLIGAAIVATASTILVNVLTSKHNTVQTDNEIQSEEVIEDEEEVEEEETLPYGELTGIPEFDKTVDGSFAQFGDIGMTDTEKHTEDNPNVGKFSKYSVAAPNDLAREYFGVEKFEDLSEENKSLCFQMSCYKQDISAMSVLKIIDPEYKNMSFEKAVMQLRESDQSVKDEKIEKLREFFQNAKPDETTVGDLSKEISNMPGAAEITKWLETQADGTLVENEQEIKDIITSTHRYVLDGHRPHEQTVATPDSAKVLEYTYQVSETEEVTIMTLERCFNGFVIYKSTDVKTRQTKITVIFFGGKEELKQKDVQNAIKSHVDQAKKEAEERGFDTIVEYYDADGPDGEVTKEQMATQPDLPKPEQNPKSKEATDTNTDKSTGYDENVNKPTTPDDPDGAAKGEQNKVKEEDTTHDEDLGDKSVDQLLKQ